MIIKLQLSLFEFIQNVVIYYELIPDFKYYRSRVLIYSIFRAFGNAYLANHLKTNKKYVIKKIELNGKDK